MEIVPASSADYPELAALYREYAFAMQSPEWLEWKYDRNPHGHALSFKVLLEGRLVGAASLEPRSYRYRGREITGFHLVDGLLREEVRGRKYLKELTTFLMGQIPPGVRPEHFHYTVPSVPASVKACGQLGGTWPARRPTWR